MIPRVPHTAIAIAALLGIACATARANPASGATSIVEAALPASNASPGGSSAPAATPKPPNVAAIVNGQAIMIGDVKDRAFQERSRHATQELIDNLLIDQAAKAAGIIVTDADIEAEKESIRKSIAPQTMEEGLKEHDLTLALFDDVRKHDLELYQLALIGVKPVKMAHVRQIFVHFSAKPGTIDLEPGKERTEAQALAVITKIQAELRAGRTFEDLAGKYDEARGDTAGDAGVVYDGAASEPLFNMAAMALKVKGQITPAPVRSNSGYRLVQLISTGNTHEPSESPLYDAAAKLWKRQQANVRIHGVLMDLRAKAHVENWIAQ